jgi:hypothetical protein
MNKLIVALFAAGFALGSSVARGEDGVAQAPDQAPRQQPSKKGKVKAFLLDSAPGSAKPAREVGDFPPFNGRTVDQWRQDEKRRKEQLRQPPPKSTTPKSTTPESTDEERAERKRLVDEWEKTQPPAPK